MGFIDYKGTKEDRYEEVLDYARAQQEEEVRRLEDQKVKKWLEGRLHTSSYTELSFSDLIKYIIVRYRNLEQCKNSIIQNNADGDVSRSSRLWRDFSIYIVDARVRNYGLSEDKHIQYVKTFISKAFKTGTAECVEAHFSAMENGAEYKQYFEENFCIEKGKQYWRWLYNADTKGTMIGFIDAYECLSVLIDYYLFLGIRPDSFEWMKQSEIEKNMLAQFKADCISKHVKNACLVNMVDIQLQNEESEEVEIVSNTYGQENLTIEVTGPETPIVEDIKQYKLDAVHYEQLLNSQDIMSYVEAFKMLLECTLSDEISNLFLDISSRLPVLKESIEEYQSSYKPDMHKFYNFYAPETLKLAAMYLDYLGKGIGASILAETEKSVMDSALRFAVVINDMIDDIYRYASMEIKARAKALQGLMGMDGYVDPSQKINI